MSRDASPQALARAGGWLYLIIIVVGIFVEIFARDRLIVPGNAAMTAANLIAGESLWRLACAGELLMMVCAIALTLVFYELLKPVSAPLALLAAFFNLVSVAVESMSGLANLAVPAMLGNASYLKAFEPQQLHALAMLSLRLYEYGFGISLVFFGFVLLTIGYLVFRSGYFPKFLGVLLPIGGLCYIVNSVALVVAPALQDVIFPAILLPSFIAELSFCLWLIFVGVDAAKFPST